jgi:hypothetical protein
MESPSRKGMRMSWSRSGGVKMLFAGMLSLAVISCQKQAAPEPVSHFEHVAPSPVGTAQTVLEKTFSLKNSATFPFEIPPHAVRPHLHGIFESFAGELHGSSDASANVDFLILNETQYGDFSGGRPGEVLFSVEGSHNQAVNFDLPASLDQPVKYYLVFRSTGSGGTKKVVEANFRVDF